MFKIYARKAEGEPCTRLGRAYRALQTAREALSRSNIYEAEIRAITPSGAERLMEVYYRKDDTLKCLSIEILKQGAPETLTQS